MHIVFQAALKPFMKGRSVYDFLVVAKGLALLTNLVADKNNLPKQVQCLLKIKTPIIMFSENAHNTIYLNKSFCNKFNRKIYYRLFCMTS